ncbi:unnamed protein product [Gadus morhua 'NCC']
MNTQNTSSSPTLQPLPHKEEPRLHPAETCNLAMLREVLMLISDAIDVRFQAGSLVLDQERVELTEHPVYATASGWAVSPNHSLGVGSRIGQWLSGEVWGHGSWGPRLDTTQHGTAGPRHNTAPCPGAPQLGWNVT